MEKTNGRIEQMEKEQKKKNVVIYHLLESEN